MDPYTDIILLFLLHAIFYHTALFCMPSIVTAANLDTFSIDPNKLGGNTAPDTALN